jgi:zinc transporter ZupT
MQYYPFVFGIVAFFSTMAGGVYVLKHPNHLGGVSALAAGVLIALSLFDLLPQTIYLASSTRLTTEFIMYIVAGGFLVLLVVQRYFSVKHVSGIGDSHDIKSSRGGWFGSAGLLVHSFIEGAAIGAGFHLNFHVGLLVAVAIIAHDFCDGINAVTIMKNSRNSGTASVVMLMAVAFAPLVGVASTLFI